MVQLGAMEIAYEDANHLRPTPMGMRVLRGEEKKLVLSLYTGTAEMRKTKKAKGREVSSDPVQQLFEQLKAVRADVARMQNASVYRLYRRGIARHGEA